MPFSASTLYNLAHGQHLQTSQKCFLCGGPCGTDIPRKPVQAAVATARGTNGPAEVIPAIPGGDYCCNGCRLMCRESITIKLPTGEIEYGQPVRDFSWLISGTEAIPHRFPKHRDILRQACLSPTLKTPWAIVLSDKRLDFMYATPVNEDKDPPYTISLNGQKISYYPHELRERIAFARSMSIAMSGIDKDIPPYERSRILAEKVGHGMFDQWNSIVDEPLSRLAMWLCPMPDEPLDMDEVPVVAQKAPRIKKKQEPLTPAERRVEVHRLREEGHTVAEIADMLNVNIASVKNDLYSKKNKPMLDEQPIV